MASGYECTHMRTHARAHTHAQVNRYGDTRLVVVLDVCIPHITYPLMENCISCRLECLFLYSIMDVEGQRKRKLFAQNHPLTVHEAVSVLELIVASSTRTGSIIAHGSSNNNDVLTQTITC